ncbi:MAG TPA: hypothetical protein PKX40_15235 [Spirochaetota bacterium]|nr:hypothetical protein [Spirochaetota bacterium]
MRKLLIPALVACSIIAMNRTPAMAVGLGFYFHGEGNKTWETRRLWDYGYGLGGGFVLDTSVARNYVFNYRLNIDASYFGVRYRGHGIRLNCTHTFGFGFIRTETLRVWMGPQILIGYNDVSRGLDANAGLALGMNVHLNSMLTLALDMGIRGGVTFYQQYVYENLGGNVYRSGHVISARDASVGLFCNVGFLFRIGDNFRKEDGGDYAAQRQKQIEEFIITNASIMTEKPVYKVTDPIIVIYKNIPDYRNCWIAISKVGDPDGTYETYNWTYSATEGKMNFGMLFLKPGSYEVRLHFNRGNTVSKRYAFTVE